MNSDQLLYSNFVFYYLNTLFSPGRITRYIEFMKNKQKTQLCADNKKTVILVRQKNVGAREIIILINYQHPIYITSHLQLYSKKKEKRSLDHHCQIAYFADLKKKVKTSAKNFFRSNIVTCAKSLDNLPNVMSQKSLVIAHITTSAPLTKICRNAQLIKKQWCTLLRCRHIHHLQILYNLIIFVFIQQPQH